LAARAGGAERRVPFFPDIGGKAQGLIDGAVAAGAGDHHGWMLEQRCRIAWDQGDVAGCEAAALALLDARVGASDGERARAVLLAVKALSVLRKYSTAAEVVAKHKCVGPLYEAAQASVHLNDEQLDAAESAAPSAASVAALGDAEDRLEGLWVRFSLWAEYGYYDNAVDELRALRALAAAAEEDGANLRFRHKAHAHVIAAALFLRDYDVIKACPLVAEYSMLPSNACNAIARIVLPMWAGLVTLSHEYLPMLRNFHYGVMPMVFRGLQLLASKKERLLQPRLLVELSRSCAALFCYDWVFDDQADRTSFEPYAAYLDGYLELRDELYIVRERMRKVWDISDSHDDLQGTGWIFINIAAALAVSPTEQGRVFLAKAYYRCLWRQGDKADLLIARQKELLPTRLLQMELHVMRAFRFYVSEKWEAFLYHHEQAVAFWESFGVSRASSLTRHTRLLPLHKQLCTLLCAYHMHHTLEHHKAVAAMEKYRCMFVEPDPAYNPDRPFDHIPPQTTVVYFVLIHHLTEVWTCVKMDHEEYQNQVVPQIFCYNYYRKKSQGPGEGKLTLLPQVKDQAIFAAQQWENAHEKEHTALSAVHLAIKPQLDSIAGIYKTYAQRVLIVPEDSLCNTPWPSMPSSNQKWFADLINANCVPGLGFYSVHNSSEKATESLLVSVRDHGEPHTEVQFKYGANELRIASHHLHSDPKNVLCDRPFAPEHRAPTLGNVLSVLTSRPAWRVVHFTGPSNARRLLLGDHEELTVSAIRAMPQFPRVELVVLAGHKPYRCQTVEGPHGLAKALLERGASVVLLSTVPLSSKKQLQLMAYLYTLLERFPDVAVDALLRLAMQQLRKTTNVFREWGSYNVMGARQGRLESLVLPPDFRWPRLFDAVDKKRPKK
jgi:hypothetical protein